MSAKFQNKYRIESARLKGHDYSAPGKYYVTINIKKRIEWFGDIIDDNVILTDIGEIAKSCYVDIPNHFKHVKLDEYVIMPDHIHGIIEITGYNAQCGNNDGADVDSSHGANLQPATQPATQPNPQTTNKPYHKPQWKPGTLGVIINQFKSSVTRNIRKKYPDHPFEWQSLFHDRIIRFNEYEQKKSYIRNNPKNYKKL